MSGSDSSTPAGLPGPDGGLRAAAGAGRHHARRLLVASAVFAVSLLAILVLVTGFILRDLGDDRVNRILNQAKAEAEAVARMANDPRTMGEPDTVTSVDAGKDREIDGEALLEDLLPGIADADGRPLARGAGPPVRGAEAGAEVPRDGAPRLVPANLSRQGQEFLTIVNGELVQRDAFQYIEMRYPGGRQIISFRRSEMRDFDRSILGEQGTRVERLHRLYRPSSRAATVSWDATIGGQPVRLEAGIDQQYLDDGIAELRRRTVPKVLAGAAAFIVLLGVAYAYVFRLLGETKRLEAQASQRAMLAQVGLLAAGLAHEIRNPLSAVQMNLQLLEEDLEDCVGGAPAPVSAAAGAVASARPAGSGDHVALLRATQREIRRLGALVTEFLTYARPATPRPSAVRLDAIVRDCAELFRVTAEGLGVQLDLDLQAGDEPVRLDEAMLKQALMNVVKNAMEAVPQPGGHVLITTRRAPGLVQVAVADDGPGVPGSLDQAFHIFQSTKKGGTGLGLPISRALIERQGGSLTARSGPLGGALFLLTFPDVPVAAERDAQAAAT